MIVWAFFKIRTLKLWHIDQLWSTNHFSVIILGQWAV